METKTEWKSGKTSGSDQSMFNWSKGSTSTLVGAAVAGAALGFAANAGRKLFVQMTSGGISGDWFELIKAEHELARGIFAKLIATDDSQTMMRSHLLANLKYALTKHALEEENVLYPALRQANLTQDADHLGEEHSYIKTYLYELETMPNNSPEWLVRVRDFRTMIDDHMQDEEEEIFPGFHERMSTEQNGRITAMMNKEGYKFA